MENPKKNTENALQNGAEDTNNSRNTGQNNDVNNNYWGIMADNPSTNLQVSGTRATNNYIGLSIRRYITGEVSNNIACGNSYRDFQCMTQDYYNTVITGHSNTFTKVTTCSNGWPVLGTNYNACS